MGKILVLALMTSSIAYASTDLGAMEETKRLQKEMNYLLESEPDTADEEQLKAEIQQSLEDAEAAEEVADREDLQLEEATEMSASNDFTSREKKELEALIDAELGSMENDSLSIQQSGVDRDMQEIQRDLEEAEKAEAKKL